MSIILISCEKKNDTIIDPSYDAPTISNPYRSVDTVFTNSASPLISFITSILVNTNGGEPITSVTCNIFDTENNSLGIFNMTDNGVPPDSTAGDRRFTVQVHISNIQCLLVGNYNIQYIAKNSEELFSNLINSTLPVANPTNLPPVLSNLNIPDSVVRPVTGFFNLTLSLTAIDPDGKCDMKDVFFYAFRPTGNPLNNGDPFYMQNTQNDIYSYTAPVLPATQDSLYGYYKYIFHATDNSNASAIPVVDSIKFVRP